MPLRRYHFDSSASWSLCFIENLDVWKYIWIYIIIIIMLHMLLLFFFCYGTIFMAVCELCAGYTLAKVGFWDKLLRTNKIMSNIQDPFVSSKQ